MAEARRIAIETKQFVCTREMCNARQHYVLSTLSHSALMERVSRRRGLNEKITMRSLNQFCQRDRTLRVPDIRIDRLPSMFWIRVKHRKNFSRNS